VFYEKLGFEARLGNEADHWLLMTNGEAYIGLMQGMFAKNMLPSFPTRTAMGSSYKRLLTSETCKNNSKKQVLRLNKRRKRGLT
jgi:hypothetical protein